MNEFIITHSKRKKIATGILFLKDANSSLLNMNEIIDEDFVLSDENIGKIKMPNASGFLLPDPRPDVTKYKDGQPCMKNCNVPVKIIGKARDIDVTPDDEKS